MKIDETGEKGYYDNAANEQRTRKNCSPLVIRITKYKNKKAY